MIPKMDNDQVCGNDVASESTALIQERSLTQTENRNSGVRTPTKTRRWAVVACCLFLQLVTMGTGFGLSVMYVEIIRQFNSYRSEASLIQSIYFFTMAGGGVIWGFMITKVGPGICTILGAFIAGLGFVLSAFSVNLSSVIVFAGLISGIGMGLCYLSSFITVSMIFHGDAGIPLVAVTIGSGIGQLVMPYMFDYLITEFQWSGAFIIMGGVVFNAAICGVYIYSCKEFLKADENRINGKSRICDVTIVKDAVLMIILICSFLLAFTGPLESWFLVDILVIRGFKRATGTFFVSLIGIANLCGRMIGAILRACCRLPSVYHWIYICPLIGLSHALVINISSYWSVFVVVMVNGITYGITVAQTPAVVYETSGRERYTQAISVLNVMYGLGDFVGGFAGGLTNDLTGSYNLIFYIGLGSSVFVSIATGTMMCFLHVIGSRRFKRLHLEDSVRYETLTSSSTSSDVTTVNSVIA